MINATDIIESKHIARFLAIASTPLLLPIAGMAVKLHVHNDSANGPNHRIIRDLTS
jgi:hypothetical protein